MKSGFVSARSVWEKDGELWTDPGLGRLVDYLSFRTQLSVALCHQTDGPKPNLYNHRIARNRIEYFPMPFMASVANGFFKFRSCQRVITEVEKRSDSLVVQLPFAAPLALLSSRKPRVYQICADLYRQVRTSPFYSGHRKWLAQPMALLIHQIQKRICSAKDARVVAHGRALLAQYGQPGRGQWVISSALEAPEMGSMSRRRPDDGVFRLLFVGYLRHEKGCDVLLKALTKVVRQKPKVELWVVGGRDKVSSGVEDDIKALIEAHDLESKIQFKDSVPFGPELFQMMADADVLLLPSRSEGTPRVLVEARAMGCPVIASRVGGIPDSVEHMEDGLVFESDDHQDLADKVLFLMNTPRERLRLIANGEKRVRPWTVEALGDSILKEMI